MMTLQLNQLLDRDSLPMMLGSRLASCKWLLLMAVLIAGDRCVAQNFSYPHSYPVVNSYPSSYPVKQPDVVVNQVPQFTKTYSSSPQSAVGGFLDSWRRPVDPLSPYELAIIQSARQSAMQFRMIAQSASPIAAEIASENANFAEQWADLAETHAALSDRVDDATAKLNTTTRDFEDVHSKLTKYGLTPTIGLLLRHKKEQLDAWQVQRFANPLREPRTETLASKAAGT